MSETRLTADKVKAFREHGDWMCGYAGTVNQILDSHERLRADLLAKDAELQQLVTLARHYLTDWEVPPVEHRQSWLIAAMHRIGDGIVLAHAIAKRDAHAITQRDAEIARLTAEREETERARLAIVSATPTDAPPAMISPPIGPILTPEEVADIYESQDIYELANSHEQLRAEIARLTAERDEAYDERLKDALASGEECNRLRARAEQAEAEIARLTQHEETTHRVLGEILGTDDALHVKAKQLRQRAEQAEAEIARLTADQETWWRYNDERSQFISVIQDELETQKSNEPTFQSAILERIADLRQRAEQAERRADAAEQKAIERCVSEPHISRFCERGTPGCKIRHRPTPAAETQETSEYRVVDAGT